VWKPLGFFGFEYFFFGFYSHRKMEVIFQQAIGKQIGNRDKMSFDQSQEERIIPLFDEDVLPVHTAIVDVIVRVIE
jgi:hypothetical protein